MEESSLSATDAADGSKFFWILGAFALVLGIVSVIIGLRANNNIEKINNTLATVQIPEQGTKVGDIEARVETFNATLVAQNKEIADLRAALSVATRQYSDLNTKMVKADNQIRALAAIVGGRTTQNPGVGQPPPPRPPPPPIGVTPGPGTPNRPGPQGGVHAVRAGDTFSRIAGQYGVTVSAIEVANPGVDSRKLKIGQQIKIPPRDTGVTPNRTQSPNRPVTPPPPGPSHRPNTTPTPAPNPTRLSRPPDNALEVVPAPAP